MNFTDYTYIINKPDAINERHNLALDKIIDQYPYFQSARVLRLKQLYNQNSFKYNVDLKVAAAYTTERSVLFDFITSKTFTTIQNEQFDAKMEQLLNINVTGVEILDFNLVPLENTLENSIINSIKSATTEENEIENSLEIGKPLQFSITEKHSFQEWLQLSRVQPIARETTIISAETDIKSKQETIIDNFIASNPKIPALNKNNFEPLPILPTIEEKSYLMTETLAKVYLEQKKYQKAIQAYEILILKYPEKSSFFAIRISDIKNVQQNNNL